MTRKNRKYLLSAAITVVVGMPMCGFAAPVDIDQTLMDEEFQLNGTDYTNSATVDVNASEVQNDPAGVNEQAGTDNIQENRSEFARAPRPNCAKTSPARTSIPIRPIFRIRKCITLWISTSRPLIRSSPMSV